MVLSELQRAKMVKVYLKNRREVEIFNRIKESIGEDDSGTFIYIMKAYAENHSLISEALHNTSR